MKPTNMWHTSYSPPTSDSSFSVSTCDSPSLSVQSEASPIAGTPRLQSPPLMFHTHFPGHATKQSKSVSLEEAPTLPNFMPIEMTEKNICHASGLDVSNKNVKDTERLVQSPDLDSSKWLSDKDWPSDGTESWASASSQELLWNGCGPAANDSDEMPKLTPDTSPVLTMGIRQGESSVWDESDEESRDWVIHSHQESRTRECRTYNLCHGGRSRSRWSSSIQSTAHDDQGCSHARDASALAFQRAEIRHRMVSRECAINLGDRHALMHPQENDAKCRGPTYCDVKRPSKQVGEAQHSLRFGTDNVADSFTSPSTSPDKHQKTTCSAPLGDPSSFSHGQFRLVEQDGSPCYSFSVHESNEVFFARACIFESLSDEDDRNDFNYAFRCRREERPKGGWKCWLRKEKLASTLVGKMKVSTARHVDGKRIDSKNRIEETHFVLYDERCHQPSAEKAIEEDDQRSAQHSRMQSSKATSRHKSMKNSMIQEEKVYVELLAVAITTSTKRHTDKGKNVNHQSPGQDGAAFVDVIGSQTGWGLRYLSNSSEHGYKSKASIQVEKLQQHLSEVMCSTHDMEKLQDSRDVSETCTPYYHPSLDEGLNHQPLVRRSKPDEQRMAVNMVVILPAGRHGNGKCSGATPLLECWQSDGKCDCGGWDMGCGLLVLRAETLKLHRTSAIALTNQDRINWILPGRPLMIFSQDHKRRKLLAMEVLQAGLFSLSFQAQFSPLQAFATAVAIFHQQTSIDRSKRSF